jgi:hypothetical protein
MFTIFAEDEPGDDRRVMLSGDAFKKLRYFLEMLANPNVGQGLHWEINEGQLTIWADTASSSPGVFPVLVTYHSGSPSPNLTYDCTTLSGGALKDGSSSTATNKSPLITAAGRVPGATINAAASGSIGIGCYDTASPPNLKLLTVGEGVGSTTYTCAVPSGSGG